MVQDFKLTIVERFKELIVNTSLKDIVDLLITYLRFYKEVFAINYGFRNELAVEMQKIINMNIKIEPDMFAKLFHASTEKQDS